MDGVLRALLFPGTAADFSIGASLAILAGIHRSHVRAGFLHGQPAHDGSRQLEPFCGRLSPQAKGGLTMAS